jgi:hypothetical protein
MLLQYIAGRGPVEAAPADWQFEHSSDGRGLAPVSQTQIALRASAPSRFPHDCAIKSGTPDADRRGNDGFRGIARARHRSVAEADTAGDTPGCRLPGGPESAEWPSFGIRRHRLCPAQRDGARRPIEGHMDALKRRRGAGCVVSLLLTGISLAAGDSDEFPLAAAPSENEIKSAMIYNFTKFVEWPDKALGDGGAPVVAGVLGDDALALVLAAALRDKTIQGHPFVVRRLGSSADAKGCALLLVGASDRKEVARILQSVGRSPVLTIGERVQFSRLGGVIAFLRDGNRVRFEINLDAAERAGLQVSSKLLRLATVWREDPPQARN